MRRAKMLQDGGLAEAEILRRTSLAEMVKRPRTELHERRSAARMWGWARSERVLVGDAQ